MEAKELVPFILLLVLTGMIIGVGLIVFDKTAVASPRTDHANVTVDPKNYTMVSLGRGNVTSCTIYNVSGEIISNKVKASCVENATTLLYYLNSTDNVSLTSSVYVVIDYKEYKTPTYDAMINNRTEIANISSNWVGLIVTVTILSIILVLVIRAFGGFQR